MTSIWLNIGFDPNFNANLDEALKQIHYFGNFENPALSKTLDKQTKDTTNHNT